VGRGPAARSSSPAAPSVFGKPYMRNKIKEASNL
jgi:hypothetical protein